MSTEHIHTLNAVAADMSVSWVARREYAMILDAFRRLIYNWEHSAERRDIIEEIITLRASFLCDRALTGLRIDFDRALDLLRGHNDFISERERQQRDLLIAALENLVDFAVAEEFTMLRELPEEPVEDRMEEYEALCERYNLTYAEVENDQVAYAAGVAAWWLTVDAQTVVTFNTQGDERVRAWHLSHEGVCYPKHAFPAELIPPLEWGCRCYLTAEGFGAVSGVVLSEQLRRHVDPIFRESLATGGRIFSAAHPYFLRPLPADLQAVARALKSRFGI